VQLDLECDVVARHHHLRAFRQLRRSRHVRRAEVELRTIAIEERRMTTTLFLRQHVDLALELGVRRNRRCLRQHHPAFHVFLRNAAQQQTSVVPSQTFIQLLLEHFHARHHRLARLAEADDFYFLAHLHLAALDSACHHRATARDREDVFDRHQEGLVDRTRRQRHVLVDRLHQLVDLRFPLRFPVQRAQSRAANHRHIVPGEVVLRQQLPHFHLDQVDQLRILNRIALVQKHHDVRHAHLPGQKHVLLGLRHRAIGCSNHENRAVHLRRARDHVLDVVSVTGAINVRIVTVPRLVLHVRRRNRDPALPLFRRIVNRVKRTELVVRVVLRQHLRDRRRQRRLPVIDMPDRPHIHVRLRPVKFLLRHVLFLSRLTANASFRQASMKPSYFLTATCPDSVR